MADPSDTRTVADGIRAHDDIPRRRRHDRILASTHIPDQLAHHRGRDVGPIEVIRDVERKAPLIDPDGNAVSVISLSKP